ncbi:MAG: CvpA family protein [Treponema sp.]|nr:CvpA family protein [Treponema sp.]
MNFSVIDIIFLILIGLFMVRCYLKGFVSELLSMAGFALGILAALYFYKNGAEFLRERFWPDLKTIPEVLSFLFLFVIVLIVVKLLAVMLKGIISGIRLGGVDRVLGLIFGLAEGIAVISLMLFFIRIQPLFDPSVIISDSFFANLLLPFITGQESMAVFQSIAPDKPGICHFFI